MKSPVINILFLISLFFSFQCCQTTKNEIPILNAPIPPDDLYLMDKMGIPTPAFLQKRDELIASIKQQTIFRNSPYLFSGLWTIEGPGNLGGRINTIAVNPKDENIIFIGFSHGGAYRTLDGGQSWTSIFDNESTLYISDIAIDPMDTRIIYIATGDHSGGFYCGQGNGLYKSQDNGISWKQIGLSETRILSEILIDYENPKTIYAASLGYSYQKNEHRGIYKSDNGGISWNKILYINDSTGITDIAMHPKDPTILFAVSWNKLGLNNRGVVNGPNGQIYKTTDGGTNWALLKDGLPSDSINGRIAIAISESDPNIMYARYVRNYRCNGQLSNNFYGLFISTDTGESWKEQPALEAGSGLDCNCLGGFGWYFHSIAVNPKDPYDLFILGIDLFRSLDGGHHWDLAVPDWSSYEVHADKHDIIFLKNGDYLLATDGGLYKHIESEDKWEDIENIPTNQVYRVAYNPNSSNFYYGGLQDNGSTGGNKLNIEKWDRIYGGDGFQMAFKSNDPTIFYAEYQNGAIQQYNNGSWRSFTEGLGGNKNWDFPFMISRHNSSKLLAGSNQVYYNPLDTGANWTSISPNLVGIPRYASRSNPTITSIDESALDSNIIIAGTVNGNVWLTKEFNTNWINVSSTLPPAYITCVKTSHSNPNTFYATLSGHRGNDFDANVYITKDNGDHWQAIQNDLPDMPVYDILIYPGRGDSILFVGNHIGVYASLDAGRSWNRVGDNMPFIEVFDLEINEVEKTLIAATFGKSIMTFPLDDILKIFVSTDDLENFNDLQVYPNPATNEIKLMGVSNTEMLSEIRIINYLGKPMIPKLDPNQIIKIDMLPDGLYFLSIKFGKKIKTISFLKQS